MSPLLRRWLALGLALGGAAALLLFTLNLAIQSLAAGWCGNTVVTRLPAPDGARTAVLFERNCGATTAFTTQISVLAQDAPLPDAAGNAFSAQMGESSEAAPWGGPAAAARWLDSSTLAISYDSWAEVFLAASRVAGAQIIYVPQP